MNKVPKSFPIPCGHVEDGALKEHVTIEQLLHKAITVKAKNGGSEHHAHQLARMLACYFFHVHPTRQGNC